MASSSSWVNASGATDRKTVIGQLTRGREMADQLRAILRDDDADSSVLPAQGLVGKILDTFTQSLLLLTGSSGDSDEVSQLPVVVNSPGRLNSEDSGDNCKKPAPKDRRGCYKRRRTSETWTIETPTVFEDGHAWRKYGQKVILHAIHPRNYFRCTHKYDQGCQATKQLQKVEDDPVPLFRTTYHGHHTCTSNLLVNKSPHDHIIMDATNDSNAIIWSFQSHDDQDYKAKTINRTGSAVTNPPTPTALVVINNSAIKQEFRSSSSSSSHELSAAAAGNQLTTFDHLSTCCGDYDHDHHELGAVLSGHGAADVISSSDVYSCTASTHSTMDMDADFMVDSVFEDFLQFR